MLGVERLRMDEFWEGNIVLDIVVRSGHEVSGNEIGHVYKLTHCENDVFVRKMLKEIVEKNLKYIEINPSYGATLWCLCAEIDIHGEWQFFEG